MKRLVVVMTVLALAGCTTTARTHAVRGVSGIEIDCSGLELVSTPTELIWFTVALSRDGT